MVGDTKSRHLATRNIASTPHVVHLNHNHSDSETVR
jgi:hypothetical protein